MEGHPVYISYRPEEGIVLRIEDKRIQWDSWSEMTKKVRSVKENGEVFGMEGFWEVEDMSEEAQSVFDFLEEVIEKRRKKQMMLEGLEP